MVFVREYSMAMCGLHFAGVWHSGGAIQLHTCHSPASGEHGRDVHYRQWGPVRYLLPYLAPVHPYQRRLEPPGVCHDVRHHHLPEIPWPIECRPPQTGRQHGAFPTTSFLYDRFRAAHIARFPVVSELDGARAYSADVRCQEYDGSMWPEAWALPDSGHSVPRQDVHEGGRRADAERAEQEQPLLRGVDP